MDEREEEVILFMVWGGVYTLDNLPRDLYAYYFAEYINAFNSGYGQPISEQEVTQSEGVRKNISEFAAAKTYSWVLPKAHG